MARSGPQTYEFRTVFRAPLPFAYAWCTDYAPSDHIAEGDSAPRKLLHRGKRRVVYEDLDEGPGGWMWSRWEVALRPPDRWHGDGLGNYRRWSADYHLTALPNGRTELHFKGRRWPVHLGTVNPPKARTERELVAMWRTFAREMERDYRRSLRRPGRRGKR